MMSIPALQKEVLAEAPTESTMTDGVRQRPLSHIFPLDHYHGHQVRRRHHPRRRRTLCQRKFKRLLPFECA